MTSEERLKRHLMKNIEKDAIDVVRKILDKMRSIDPNLEKQPLPMDSDLHPGSTPLMIACGFGRTEIIQLLVEREHSLPNLHKENCDCDICRNLTKEEQRKLNYHIIRAAANPAYIRLTQPDEIGYSIKCSREIDLKYRSPHFGDFYDLLKRGMEESCTSLFKLCRPLETDIIFLRSPDRRYNFYAYPGLEAMIDVKWKILTSQMQAQEFRDRIWVGQHPINIFSLTLLLLLQPIFLAVNRFASTTTLQSKYITQVINETLFSISLIGGWYAKYRMIVIYLWIMSILCVVVLRLAGTGLKKTMQNSFLDIVSFIIMTATLSNFAFVEMLVGWTFLRLIYVGSFRLSYTANDQLERKLYSAFATLSAVSALIVCVGHLSHWIANFAIILMIVNAIVTVKYELFNSEAFIHNNEYNFLWTSYVLQSVNENCWMPFPYTVFEFVLDLVQIFKRKYQFEEDQYEQLMATLITRLKARTH